MQRFKKSTGASYFLYQYRTCMSIAGRIFVLADSTKFKPGGAAVVASFDELNDIVTDDSIQKEVSDNLKAKGVRVHIAKT